MTMIDVSKLTIDPALLELASPAELQAYQDALEEEVYLASPSAFAHHVDPDFHLYRHVLYLDQYLLRVFNGEIRKLMIWEPPRHGKSEQTTKYFPAWWLKKRPKDDVIISTYGFDFASEWGEKSREVYRSFRFGVPLGRRQANANWRTLRGGGVICAGVDGGITGRGGNLFVLDDPIKNAIEAKSELQRNNAKEFYQSTARTRLQPSKESGLPGAIVIIQTRWHEDDLSGWLLETEGEYHPETNPNGWVVVRLPALAEDDDPLGRAPGEALCPERYPTEELEGIRATSDPYWWNCMYQQNPIPAEGTIIPIQNFKTWNLRYVDDEEYYQIGGVMVKAANCFRYGTIDLAASEKTSADYTVGLIADLTPPDAFVDGLRRLIIRNVKRERIDTTKHMDFLLDLINEGCKFVGVEKKTFGLNLIQNARRRGLPVREIIVDTDKVSRAMEMIDLMDRICIPAEAEGLSEWLSPMLSELAAFPNGRHDDIADCVVYATRVLAQYSMYVRKKDEKKPGHDLDPASKRASDMIERLSKRSKKRRHSVLGRF